VAASKKNARRLNAHLVFLDESGLLLAPLVRRTWAPRGQTPILYQRTAHRDKASAIAALSLSPRRQRVGLYFAVLPDENVTAAPLLHFLAALRRHLPGRRILIWDRLACHRAQRLTAFRARCPRLQIVWLPPYAPELNPVEFLWAFLKLNPLANHPAVNSYFLAATARRHLQRLGPQQALLQSFFRATPLFSCSR
jgi:transposase